MHAIALDSAPLASRRPLFAPCLPSTCSRACVQSPCGSLRLITLTVLNRGELAVVGHCKFAGMLYSSDELVVVVCFFSKTASIISTTATGQSVKSVFAFIVYHFGGVSATRAFALWCSTSASGRLGVFRRREGHLLAAHLGPSLRPRLVLRFPSFRVVSSFRGSPPVGPPLEWSTLPSSLGMCSFLRTSIRDEYIFWGRRTCFPSAVVLAYSHRFQFPLILVYGFRGVSVYKGGRTCFPTAFEYVDIIIFCISSILLFTCMRIVCSSSSSSF